MPTLHVRNVPEQLHKGLRLLAERRHRSLGAEVIALLEQALSAEEVREAQEHRLASIRRRRSLSGSTADADSVDLLREDRAR